ncbi:hypothetical protein HBH98_255690 [Parastagonospora nodorum]|nr:hypothetical protein HBH53_263660 [Parastagonospora nodorum]KAH3955994.1 hypothetical protein HBH51_258780 [Parastagonospora nodorum]KAH4215272.1 hypothetical protein HBI06_257930 [Parastagonospora nodorum]KAH4221309.1 hypothetical protein HBI05_256200 [Parastagonospora nodorum]KAH4331538.1 hypothetical protein HBH98_255690 [Parastagonospora nodorum]
MPTDENEKILDESLELINQNNQEIQKSNLEFQIPADRNALPVQELQKIKTAWTTGDQEELSKSIAEFVMLLGARAPAAELYKQLSPGIKGKAVRPSASAVPTQAAASPVALHID